MQSCLLLCVVLIAGVAADTVSLPQQQQEKANQYTAECIKETGVKPETIADAKKGVFTEDEGLKKFTFCFFQKANILDKDANLNIDVALSKLPPGVNKDDAKKLLEVCQAKTGKNTVDTAFEKFKCYRASTKTHIALGF